MTTVKKTFMEILREFASENPLEDGKTITNEQHGNLIKQIENGGYGYIDMLNLDTTDEEHKLLSRYILGELS